MENCFSNLNFAEVRKERIVDAQIDGRHALAGEDIGVAAAAGALHCRSQLQTGAGLQSFLKERAVIGHTQGGVGEPGREGEIAAGFPGRIRAAPAHIFNLFLKSGFLLSADVLCIYLCLSSGKLRITRF